jgi:4-hydroxy-3-methylbut-2-en-1-yl diphosphate reductase
MRILLAQPRGFCAGVDRAIDVVELCLELYGPPVYVRHAIVHNVHVVRSLEAKGAVFVEELRDVPEGSLTVFSAHGVSPDVRTEAVNRKLRVVDATCPLVTRVHLEVLRYSREGYRIILIGHRGHVEMIGTMGEAPEAVSLVSSLDDIAKLPPYGGKLIYLSQTTLSIDDTADMIDALKKRYPHIEAPPKTDICYATTNRQTAVKDLAKHADIIFVLGSATSSNSNRLVETARRAGARSILVEDLDSFDMSLIQDANVVGITAGASTPSTFIDMFVEFLKTNGAKSVESLVTVDEHVWFTLPPDLQQEAEAKKPDHMIVKKHTIKSSSSMRVR